MTSHHRHRFAWLALALSTVAIAQAGSLITQSFSSPAHAQDITDTDVANYAQTVLSIEDLRLVAYGAANDVLVAAGLEDGILETRLSCANHRMSDMPDLPKADKVSVRTVLVEFCNEASAIAADNNLTSQQFSDITAAQKDDPALAEQIQAAMSGL